MESGPSTLRVTGVLALIVALAGVGIAVGYGLGTSLSSTNSLRTSTVTTTTGQGSNSSAPFVLTLVITTGNTFDSSVGEQPAFYVLGSDGLQSSANISLPANRLIELVIVNYDEGPANLADPKDSVVTGVVGNQVTVVNNTQVNSTMGSSGIDIKGVEKISSLPADSVSHTFTIPSLGINIPIPTLSTVVAYVTLSPGTYAWFCMTACGSGADGLEGAMATPGWMTGSVEAK